MSRVLTMLAASAIWLSAACGAGGPRPAPLDTRTDTCAVCRMLVSDRPLASQIVAPREEPLFFDHPRCLADYLHRHAELGAGAVIYTVDAAGAWVATERAAALAAAAHAAPMGGAR